MKRYAMAALDAVRCAHANRSTGAADRRRSIGNRTEPHVKVCNWWAMWCAELGSSREPVCPSGGRALGRVETTGKPETLCRVNGARHGYGPIRDIHSDFSCAQDELWVGQEPPCGDVQPCAGIACPLPALWRPTAHRGNRRLAADRSAVNAIDLQARDAVARQAVGPHLLMFSKWS